MYQIFYRKITQDLCTYRLKLRKGVSVVFMATLPMNVILKNELGIWNTPDISIVYGILYVLKIDSISVQWNILIGPWGRVYRQSKSVIKVTFEMKLFTK